MNTARRNAYALTTLLLVVAGGTCGMAQEAHPASEVPQTKEDIVELSPFQVNTGTDKGYHARTETTGTRTEAAIQDLPMSLEVVTNAFMEDTGSVDLREAVRYSPGMVLETQYEGLARATEFDDPISAGANDPEGRTRDRNQSVYRLRGNVIDHTLRDGFLRKFPTDWINIERVEILRGPNSMLYGSGNMGGAINTIVKRPTTTPHYTTRATVGTNEFLRLEFDTSDQFNRGNDLDQGFRVTGSWQSNGAYGDGTYHRDAWFLSPVVAFELPNRTTFLTLDTEFGHIREEGIGFNSVRAWISDALVPTDNQTRTNGFVIPGAGTANEKSVRDWRWSGEDTYIEDSVFNVLADIEQRIGDRTWVRLGVQVSRTESEGRNVTNASLQALDETRWSHHWYRDPETIEEQIFIDAMRALNPYGVNMKVDTPQCLPQRIPQLTSMFENRPQNMWYGDLYDAGPVTSQSPLPNGDRPLDRFTTQDYVVLAYQWAELETEESIDQGRVELVHEFDLAGSPNTVLVGAQTFRETVNEVRIGVPNHGLGDTLVRQAWNLTSVQNPTRIRYDVQGDGVTPSVPIEPLGRFETEIEERGVYALLQSRMWEDRIHLVLGGRWQHSSHTESTFSITGEESWIHEGADSENFNPQIGLSVALSPQISLFGLYSTGFQPNYGAMDGAGRPFDPMEAVSREFGVKFDLLEKRLTGTVSAFDITRNNIAREIWWAPSPGIPALRKNAPANYDPNQPTAVSNSGYHPYLAWLCMDQPGFEQTDPVAYEFWKGVPRDPRDPSRPYGFGDPAVDREFGPGWQFETDINWIHSTVPDPQDDWKRKTFGELWMEYGEFTQEQYDNAERYWETLHSAERYTLIPIDPETEAGRAGRYLVELGLEAQANGNLNWFNWIYAKNGTPGVFADGTEGVVNWQGSEYGGASLPYSDHTRGVDFEVVWNPIVGLQVTGGYAYVESEVTTDRYAYAPIVDINDQVALGAWNFPADNWGTFGQPPENAFSDPSDPTTSTLKPIEYGGPLDDTPKRMASFWIKYDFRHDSLKGLGLGFGGRYESGRMYLAGAAQDGTGIGALSPTGRFRVDRAYTDPRLTFDGLIEYRFNVADICRAHVALNIYNITDDKDLYGFIYAPGRSARLSLGLDF